MINKSSVNFVGIEPWNIELRCKLLNLIGKSLDLSGLSESVLEVLELFGAALLLDTLALGNQMIDEDTDLSHVLLEVATSGHCRGTDTHSTWGHS